MFTRIITSSLLFLIAIGGFVVSYDTGTVKVNESYAAIVAVNTTTLQGVNAASATPATAAAVEAENNALTKALNGILNGLNIILLFLTILVSPAIMFASWLMSPDWTSGDIFQLRDKMHGLWVIISNIVYFIYAILLILIALGTIFGKDNFSYKKMLPRLALGILMVPFTWWFVQWTISISAYMTASVMSIPAGIIKDKNGSTVFNRSNIPRNFYLSADKDDMKAPVKCNKDNLNRETECISTMDFLSKGNGMYGSLVVYAYEVFKIHELKDLSFSGDSAKDVARLVNDALLGVVMFIIFGLLVLALVSMLLIRVIKLWMYAIFSPLFTLHFVAGKELLGDKMGDFNIKEFIGLCFVPAIVGLSLSFGLIIISAVQSPGAEQKFTGDKCTTTILKTTGCPLKALFTTTKRVIPDGTGSPQKWKTQETIEVAGVNVHFIGKSVSHADIEAIATDTDNTAGLGYSILSSGGGILGTLIVDVIALVFIWGAFMAAKGASKAVGAAIEPFEKMGKSIGGMATSLPKYIPIGGMSINGMQKAAEHVSYMPQKASEERMKDSPLGRALGMGEQASPTDMAQLKQLIKDKENFKKQGSTEFKQIGEKIRSNAGLHDKSGAMKEAFDGLKEAYNNNPTAIADALKKMGINEVHATKLGDLIANGKTDPNDIDTAKILKEIRKSGSAGGGNQGGTASSGITANQRGQTNNYDISFNGGTVEADVGAKTVNNLSIDLTKIVDKSLGKKDDYKKYLLDGLTPKVGLEIATKITDEIMKKIPDGKFQI